MPVSFDRPHLKYPSIREDAKEAIRELFDARPHQSEEPVSVASPFIDRISHAYNVPVPYVEINERIWDRYSYRPGNRYSLSSENDPGRITLRQFTIIDLLTALRKHINSHTGSRLDEHAWACSAFYAVKPVRFRKLAREGRIPGVSAAATYKTETWEQIVAEGRGDVWTGRLIVEEVSEETMEAAAEYVDAMIEEEAIEGVEEIESFLQIDTDGTMTIPGPINVSRQPDDIESMNRDQLRSEAACLNIPGRGTMLVSELREAVRQARRNA